MYRQTHSYVPCSYEVYAVVTTMAMMMSTIEPMKANQNQPRKLRILGVQLAPWCNWAGLPNISPTLTWSRWWMCWCLSGFPWIEMDWMKKFQWPSFLAPIDLHGCPWHELWRDRGVWGAPFFLPVGRKNNDRKMLRELISNGWRLGRNDISWYLHQNSRLGCKVQPCQERYVDTKKRRYFTSLLFHD